MAYVVDSLTLKLESKISYHTDAKLVFMELKAMVDELVKENTKLQGEKMEYLDMSNTLMNKKNKLEDDYEAIKEQLAPLEEQLETAEKKLAAAERELVAAKEELAAAERELVAAKEEFAGAKPELAAAKEEIAAVKKELVAANHGNVVAKQELAQKNKELGVLRKKLQESEAMHTQFQQQIVTRSAHKKELLLQGSLLNDADGNCLKKRKSYPQLPIAGQSASRGDDLELVGQMLIKGFTKTDAGQHVGLKELGKLNEKPFRDACARQLPPSQSAARASEIYTEWHELISNPEWKPFKTVTVDGNRQEEVIDFDDEKLQGLKMAWGEGPYKSVIRALVERKKHNCDGTVVDIWNYKEGRKATIGEFAEHILDQLKQFRLKTC